ncbi:MAG: hypothetical protein ABMB14_32985 [Myxococcota bacterium]
MVAALLTAVAVGLPVPAAADDVGLRVLTQPWTPWTDDDTVYTVVDNPTFLSDTFRALWAQRYDELDEMLTNWLGLGDLITDGITLYRIDLSIPEPNFSLSRGPNVPGADLALDATFEFTGIHIDAKSTIPELDSIFDPACTLDFDLVVTAPVAVGTDVAAPLAPAITPAEAATRQILRVSNVRLDSQNATGDFLVALARAVELDDMLTDLINDPSSDVSSSVNTLLIDLLTGVLADANAGIAGAVPAGLVGVTAFKDPMTPLTLAFSADPSIWPDAGTGGSISGAFSSPTGSIQCADLPISIARKTGPRPIVTASGALGPVPSVPLEAHLDCSGDGGSYTLGGLSEGFPTLIGTYAEVDCAADASAEGHVVMLGGVPPRVLPSELWGDYPLTADLFEFPCGPPVVITPEVPQSASDIPDPLHDPDYEFLPWWDEGYAYQATGLATQVVLVPLTFDQYQYNP